MTVADLARAREIGEVLHFTSQMGLQGFVIKQALLSRLRAEDDPEVAFAIEGIWDRVDPAHVDYISMSLTRINSKLLFFSAQRFPDYWWAILSFDVAVLDTPGTIFTTTNNKYEAVCQRGTGVAGFEAMFQQEVPWGYRGSVRQRHQHTPDSRTTDPQAEVLLPGELSAQALQAVYVREPEQGYVVTAWADAYGMPEPTVVVDPSKFE